MCSSHLSILQEEVRRHFNCSTLEGAELEDQGLDGTALTHWEKRVFEVSERERQTDKQTCYGMLDITTILCTMRLHTFIAVLDSSTGITLKYQNTQSILVVINSHLRALTSLPMSLLKSYI